MKTLPNRYIFEEVEAILEKGGTVKLKLVGNSMLPLLRSHSDIVVLTPVMPQQLRRGAVVLFRYRGQYLLHRIIGQRQGYFRLCGDGNCGQTETAGPDDIVGVLCRVEHADGRITDCRSWRWRFQSQIWMLLRPFRKYLLGIYRLISDNRQNNR